MSSLASLPEVTPGPAGLAVMPELAALPNYRLIGWMFKFIAPVKWEALFSCACLALFVLAEIKVTTTFADGLNTVIHLPQDGAGNRPGFWSWLNGTGSGGAGNLRRTAVMLIAWVAVFLTMRYVREVANSKMSMRMVFFLREAIYDKLQRVGFGFHDAVSTGQLITRALTDLQNVRQFVQSALLTSLEIVLVLVMWIVALWTRSHVIALLSLVPLPLWVWYILRFGKRMQPAQKATMEAEERTTSVITENIAGVHVVKAFATQEQEIQKFTTEAHTFFVKVMARVRLWANFNPVVRAIGTGSQLSLFFAVSVLVIYGKLEAGDFLVLGAAMGAILGRLQQVSAINDQYQNAIVSARRLYEVLMAPPTVPEKLDAKPLPVGPGRVTFENVSFGYDSNKPVLQDVNFDVPGGHIVAIVGPTGAGKTTLVSLLSRFYDPQKGRVMIDGVDLRDAALGSVRTEVGIVFQETYLFSDTVEANIAYGRPGVKGGEVEAAARLAQAHDFIEALPRGYHSILGERGSSLSGGQKQRLAIARAILFNPRVLILDDATAAIDPETEDLIRRGMNLVMSDRTVFLIAHRISTVKRADLVLVVEGGRITEMGTHAELMAGDGHYRHIAEVQLYGDDEEEARVLTGPDSPSHMKRVGNPRVVNAASQASKPGETQPVEEQTA